jgi:PAS domain S-box-containing protein
VNGLSLSSWLIFMDELTALACLLLAGLTSFLAWRRRDLSGIAVLHVQAVLLATTGLCFWQGELQGQPPGIRIFVAFVAWLAVPFYVAFVRSMLAFRNPTEFEDEIHSHRKVAVDNQKRFQTLWDSNMVGMMIGDTYGNLLEVNDAYLQLVGYSRQEFEAGKVRWSELTPTEFAEREHEAIQEFQAQGACKPYEKQYSHKDGHRVDVVIVYALLQAGDPALAIGYVLDVTESKQKIETEKATLRRKQFLFNMSHELRSPLHNIMTATDMVLEGLLGDMSDKQLEINYLIQRNAKHLLNIINDILDISRIEAGKYILVIENIDPLALVDDVLLLVRSLFDQKTQTLTIRLDESVPSVFPGDPLRLKQALVNLLSNANKYSPENTEVTLDLTFDSQAEEIRIAVKDAGSGISQEALDYILKPFERVSSSTIDNIPGSGLGLPIAQKIVEQHQGRLEIHSSVGSGSEFVMVLPLNPQPLPHFQSKALKTVLEHVLQEAER